LNTDEGDKLTEFARKHNVVMAKSSKVNQKTTIYVLTSDELNSKDKSDFEKDFMRCFDPSKFDLLFIRDLHPAQLKRVLEEYKTVYLDDQELCDAILAAILTLSHDFRYFVNEKMNISLRKKLKEILSGYTSEK